MSRKFLLLFACLIIAACNNIAFAESIVIGSPPIPPVSGEGEQPGYLKDIVREAGKRAGIEITFISLPAQRSLMSSDAGITDGELHRIAGIEKHYPNLVRVPEAVLIDQFVGFSAVENVHIDNWADTGSLKISYPRGWEIYAKAFDEDKNHFPGIDAKSLFHMTAVHRIDIAMHTLDKGTYIAHSEGLVLYPVSPPFAIKEMYIYLHTSKAHLIPALTSALAEVKKDGTYSRIKREVLARHGLHDEAYFKTPFDRAPE